MVYCRQERAMAHEQRFYVAQHENKEQQARGLALRAGNQWNDRAQQLLLTGSNNSAVEIAMVRFSSALCPPAVFISHDEDRNEAFLTAWANNCRLGRCLTS